MYFHEVRVIIAVLISNCALTTNMPIISNHALSLIIQNYNVSIIYEQIKFGLSYFIILCKVEPITSTLTVRDLIYECRDWKDRSKFS